MKDITVDDITTGTLDGTGVYDKLMQVNKLHLQQEYTAQRITGDKYAEAYIAMMQSAMQTAASFAIQSITANNQRELTLEEKARIVAQTEMIKAETLNVPKQGILLDKQATQVDAQTSLVTAQEAQVVAETLNVPKQGALLDSQKSLVDKQALTETEQTKLVTAQTAVQTANKSNVEKDTLVKTEQINKLKADTLFVGKQEDLVDAQILTEKTNTTTPTQGIKKAEYDNLTKQGLNIESNTKLVTQKTKTEEAQIKDRVTGEASDVTGVVGSQKRVHAAQAKAFRDESYIKAAKQHADAFAVILSNDEGATIPTAFQSTAISTAVADMIAEIKKAT